MNNKLVLFRSQFGVQQSVRIPSGTFIQSNQELAGFLSHVENLLSDIEQIRGITEKIALNHAVILASFDNNAAKQENMHYMENVKTLARKVHNALKALKQTLDLANEEEKKNTEFRVKKAQYNTVSHRFTETMAEYNSTQEAYQEKSKEQIRRQMQFTGKLVTESELDTLLERNDLLKPLLGTDALKSAQTEVEARQKEIQLLEQNILELRDMFYDIALLVDEQGDVVDRISDQVEQAATYVQRGGEQLQQAVVYKQNNRRLKLCILFIVLAVVFAVIIAAVIVIAVPLAVNKS